MAVGYRSEDLLSPKEGSRFMRIGLLHPGAMGVSLGRVLMENGHDVLWASQGRGIDTRSRAKTFVDAGTLDTLVDQADGIVSICPPEFATAVARDVMAAGFGGLYIDGNAISPTTARKVGDIVGENYVDGGVIGPPADKTGTTRLYLSGARASEVQTWFAIGPLDARVLSNDPVAASTLKMCFAAWTKGSAALLLNVRALAAATGMTDELLREWEISQPGLAQRSEGAAIGTAPKAWRFVAEMNEIAQTFTDAGLPHTFHHGAASVYERLASLKTESDIDIDGVLRRLIDGEKKD